MSLRVSTKGLLLQVEGWVSGDSCQVSQWQAQVTVTVWEEEGSVMCDINNDFSDLIKYYTCVVL